MARPITITPRLTSANARPKGPIGLVLDDDVADFLIEVFRTSPLVSAVDDMTDTDDPICEACELVALAEDEGDPDDADAEIEQAARDANIHDRIMGFAEGYDHGRNGVYDATLGYTGEALMAYQAGFKNGRVA